MIFLLGGHGFVGSAFARWAHRHGRPLHVITRDNYKDYIGKSCDVFINANGNSRKFFAASHPREEFEASVTSVRNSLVDFDYKTYVFLSTSDIYPDCSDTGQTLETTPIDITRQSPYGFHKYLAEQCVRHAAKNWLIFRQGGFVGPGLKKNPVYDVLHGEKLWVHPESSFQFINTDDSAQLIMAMVDRGIGNDLFNITADGTISVRQLLEMAQRNLPVDPSAKPVHYQICTDKIAQHVRLPDTQTTVSSFIQSCLS